MDAIMNGFWWGFGSGCGIVFGFIAALITLCFLFGLGNRRKPPRKPPDPSTTPPEKPGA